MKTYIVCSGQNGRCVVVGERENVEVDAADAERLLAAVESRLT